MKKKILAIIIPLIIIISSTLQGQTCTNNFHPCDIFTNVSITTSLVVNSDTVITKTRFNDSLIAIRSYITSSQRRLVDTFNSTLYVGVNSGNRTQTGIQNLSIGFNTLYSVTVGSYNTAIGTFSQRFVNWGHDNTTVGNQTLQYCDSCFETTVMGSLSGFHLTNAWGNTFYGFNSGSQTTQGGFNTFIGHSAGLNNTVGGSNTFIGRASGDHDIAAGFTVNVGHASGFYDIDGQSNTFVGNIAGCNLNPLLSNYHGSYNACFGEYAGPTDTNISYSVALGPYAQYGAPHVLSLGGTGVHYTHVVMGGTIPDHTSVFDIRGDSTGGLLVPILNNTQQTAIGTPAFGDLIRNSVTSQLNVYQNNRWGSIVSAGGRIGTTNAALSTQLITGEDLFGSGDIMTFQEASATTGLALAYTRHDLVTRDFISIVPNSGIDDIQIGLSTGFWNNIILVNGGGSFTLGGNGDATASNNIVVAGTNPNSIVFTSDAPTPSQGTLTTLPGNVIGGSGIMLGAPNDWYYVKVNGTWRKTPCY